MTVRVIHGDCLAEIPKLIAEGIVVDSVCCDPPYHLTPTVKRFSKDGSAPAQFGKDGAMARLSAGFMSAKWDGGDIAFRPETWAAVASVMRPGAFLVAFGGCRTYHRLTCAIEDAGFVIQDCLMFMFATGFPKRRDMLKPAFEPIVLAYKPGGKRTMHVEECRIGTEVLAEITAGQARLGTFERADMVTPERAGRWPANIAHDGSDEVVACFPESVGANGGEGSFVQHTWMARETPQDIQRDKGSAARFFFSAKAGPEDRWGSRHPTVKPVDLISWLVKLVTPHGGTFLDPFAGSGTSAVAALKTGRNAILIEREDSYVADIRERIAFYEGGGTHSVQAKNRSRKVDHGPLFAEPLTPEEDEADALGSYNVAVMAIGEQVKAGAPVPSFMKSRATDGSPVPEAAPPNTESHPITAVDAAND